MYRARRRRLLLGVAVALVRANTAGQLLNDTGHGGTATVGPRNGSGELFARPVTSSLRGNRAQPNRANTVMEQT